nr:hypothetical protein CFP56_22488 [Quercus suber]
MDTPAAGPQASTRNSANRRPSYKHSSAQSIATIDQRLCHLESRRASNGKQNQGPILARSAAAIALDSDLETFEDQLEYFKGLTADLDETDRRLESRLNFVEDARSTTQERLRKLESAAESEALPLVSVAEQLRNRDERIEKLEDGLRARDERLKRLEETIRPYKLYLDKAKEADQKLNQSMMQIKTFLDSRKLGKNASPLVGPPSNTNGAETKPRDELAKPVLPQQSAEDIARSLIFMLAEGASIDEDVVFALNAAWTKSRNKKANMESTKETFRNEPLQDRDDSRPWEAPSKLTPTLHTPAEETPIEHQWRRDQASR